MKKGKTLYLWLIVIIFILLWIPYFQNYSGDSGTILFFNGEFTFVGLYPILLFLGVIEGIIILLYLKTLIDDMSKSSPKKFDL